MSKAGCVLTCAALAAALGLLPSCMLVMGQFSEESAEPSVSVEPPPFFTAVDIAYSETFEAYTLYPDVPYFLRSLTADIEVLEPAALEETGRLTAREVVTVLGQDTTGEYAIIKTQENVTAYARAGDIARYVPESMYKVAHTPNPGVNAATLVELGSVLLDSIMSPALYQANNYLGTAPLYERPYILIDVKCARKLLAAQAAAAELGYTLRFLDGYHSQAIQYAIYKLAGNDAYVPNPKDISRSAQGVAVDVTLFTAGGSAVRFPTAPFTFTSAAARPFESAAAAERQNAAILEEVMRAAGFLPVQENWWHFYDPSFNYIITNLSSDNMLLTAADRDW
jgi:D-alanyl-D-alanine dipeptidase